MIQKPSAIPAPRMVPIYLPEKSSAERRIAVLVFLVSFAYLCLFRRYTTMEPDEGIILQGAARILRGEVLYGDFFSYFTPGSYYLLALLFKIFGNSMLVARTTLAVYGSLFPVLTYLLARRVCSRQIALIVAGLVVLTCLPYRFLVLHNWNGTLWACLAVYCAVRYLEGSSWQWALMTGSSVSLTVLFEQSKGAGLILGLGAGFLLTALAGRRVVSSRVVWFALGGGLFWPFIATFAWFGEQHALAPMLADWLWPLQHYSQANLVPYGYQNWSDTSRTALFGSPGWVPRLVAVLVVIPGFIVPFLPLVALAILVYTTARGVRMKTLGDRDAHFVIVSAALSGLLLSVIIVRADIIHFMYLAPLFYLVLAWALDGSGIRSVLFTAFRPALRVFLLIVFGFFAAALGLRGLGANVRVETRRGVLNASAPDTVLEYVQAHVAPGSRIFVYPYLPLYYYLTDTVSPSGFDYVQPGMHTPEQMAEVMHDLTTERTPVVLYELAFAEKIPRAWPNTPTDFIAKDPVADFILDRYHPCKLLVSAAGWRFVLMVRKDLACPDKSPAGQMEHAD